MVKVRHTLVAEWSTPVKHYDEMSEDEIADWEKSQTESGDQLDVVLDNIVDESIEVSFYDSDDEEKTP